MPLGEQKPVPMLGGFYRIVKRGGVDMELYSVIKNDGPADVLCWKFPGEDFNNGSQLIVAESEEALLFRDGIVEQIFDGGKYTLGTNNYPFISELRSFMSGGVSAFNCKVYFINKVHKLELLWGTDAPIQMRDPVYNLQTSIRARGSYSIQVANSKKFLIKLIDSNIRVFTKQELNNYFRSAFLQHIKDKIPQIIKASGREILDICTEKAAIAEALTPVLNDVLDEYGVRVVNFYISGIDVPENDPNRQVLEKAFARKAELGILGAEWGRIQAAEILRDLAGNPGAGGVAVAEAALEGGTAAGSAFAGMSDQLFASAGQQAQPQQQGGSGLAQTAAVRNIATVRCPECNAVNTRSAKFCNECGAKLKAGRTFCSNCGVEMPETAKFCSECGAKRM